jgi:Protein of unknown function (DUF3024)
MAIPEQDLARIRRWCDTRVPENLWDQVKVEADASTTHVTIVEVRPPWDHVGDPTRFPIARLRWNRAKGHWSLYWRDRNSAFHEYDLSNPTPRVQRLLDVIDRDDTCIFWG